MWFQGWKFSFHGLLLLCWVSFLMWSMIFSSFGPFGCVSLLVFAISHSNSLTCWFFFVQKHNISQLPKFSWREVFTHLPCLWEKFCFLLVPCNLKKNQFSSLSFVVCNFRAFFTLWFWVSQHSEVKSSKTVPFLPCHFFRVSWGQFFTVFQLYIPVVWHCGNRRHFWCFIFIMCTSAGNQKETEKGCAQFI